MSFIRDVKNKIRDSYRQKRRELSPEQRASMDARIVAHFRALASYRFADILLAYYPLDGEVDIRPLLGDALAAGKRVALPRCASEGSDMDFYFISSLDELVPGRFGIHEPASDCERFDRTSETPSMIIIPALVYDRLGYRLGYGRGFYDRYVGTYKGVKAGLCYNAFVRSTPLPKGRFDIAVDYIVTEKGVRLIEKA